MSLPTQLLPQHVDTALANVRRHIVEAIARAITIQLRSVESTDVLTQLMQNIITPLVNIAEDIGEIGDPGTFSDNVHKGHGQH